MSRLKIVLLVSALVLVALILNAVPATTDVGGEWNFKMTTPKGERASTITFVQDGEKLTVTMVGLRGKSKGEGTLKGNDIEWSVTRKPRAGGLIIKYKGKVEGAAMSGEAVAGDRAPVKWSATKKTA